MFGIFGVIILLSLFDVVSVSLSTFSLFYIINGYTHWDSLFPIWPTKSPLPAKSPPVNKGTRDKMIQFCISNFKQKFLALVSACAVTQRHLSRLRSALAPRSLVSEYCPKITKPTTVEPTHKAGSLNNNCITHPWGGKGGQTNGYTH